MKPCQAPFLTRTAEINYEKKIGKNTDASWTPCYQTFNRSVKKSKRKQKQYPKIPIDFVTVFPLKIKNGNTVTKSMGCSKTHSKGEVYSETGLLQETKKSLII